jgi:PPP family 3-phenylpropionic acid transporter
VSPRIRLTLWYVLFLAAVGAFHPYLAVVLDDAGASGRTKAAILSLFPAGSILAGPGLTWVADRTGHSVRVLRISIGVSAAMALVLTAELSLFWMVPCVAVLSFARAPSTSIIDMLTARRLGMGKAGYGSVRAWGSVGFIASAAGVGLVLDSAPLAPLYVHAALLVGVVLLTWNIPAQQEPPNPQSSAAITEVLKRPVLVALYGVGVLHQSTISFYDHFYALHVTRTLELGSWVASASIVLGVGLEVLVLARGHRLLSRFGPGWLIVVGVASGLPRWLLTASTADPLLLIATQSLHGIGFGAWWVGAIALVDRHAPGRLRNSAQGLFMAFSHGLGTLFAMTAAGLLLDRSSTTTVFLSSAVFSTLALVGALAFLLPALRRSKTFGADESRGEER